MAYEISECYWCSYVCFFFFKQKTAYEISECDWSSDVCSSDQLQSHSEISYAVFCLKSEEHTSELQSHSETSYPSKYFSYRVVRYTGYRPETTEPLHCWSSSLLL